MNKLLLVEDDESLALGIEFTLKDEGYEVARASTIAAAKASFDASHPDLIILDVNLPDGNGYDFCKSIREKSDVPIIFLTALDEEVNLVLGLDIGGDDYITKPFRVRELLSRIKALLRRNSKNISTGSILASGDISLNMSAAVVKKGGKDIALSSQEYKILLLFMSKPHVLIKRDELLSELTDGEEVFFEENTISVYIKRLRDKIENNPREPGYILTQRGMGYKWDRDVSRE